MSELQQRWRNFLVPRIGQGAKVDGADYVCKFVEAETAALSARIAELEGARAKAWNAAETPTLNKCQCYRKSMVKKWDHDQPVWLTFGEAQAAARADIAIALQDQAAELGRLRSVIEKVRAIRESWEGTNEALDLDLGEALAAFDRAPAQAEPQDAPSLAFRAEIIGIVCKALNGAPQKTLQNYVVFLIEKMAKAGFAEDAKAFQRVLDHVGKEERIIALQADHRPSDREGGER